MPSAWFPYPQAIDVGTMQVEIRTATEPALLLPRVRKAVGGFAPELALLEPTTQQTVFDHSIAGEMIMARLATAFSLLAMLLVAIGLYGVIAHGVIRRTGEIGLRLAVGAPARSVLWMVLRRAFFLCAAGIAVGLPAALAVSRILQSMLYGVAPGDPFSVIGALLAILVIVIAAAYLPARRASLIDPVQALRWE
jgi:hypothetical protein